MPWMTTVLVKSGSLTDGSIRRLMTPRLRTVGTKANSTPNFLYSIVTVGAPLDVVLGTGMGYSPPARKRAVSPESAVRFGSASRRIRPFCSNAVTSASRLPWPLLMILARMVANGPAAVVSNVPPWLGVVKIGTPPAPGPACVIGDAVPGAPVLKPRVPLPLAKNRLTPRSRPALRATSRKRTSSITCCDGAICIALTTASPAMPFATASARSATTVSGTTPVNVT